MIYLVSTSFLPVGTSARFYLVEKIFPWMSSTSARYISTNSKQYSFSATYVMQTFGFSRKSAILTTKHLNFKTPDKPNSVLAFFKNHGFSHAQVSQVIRKYPQLLASNPEKTLSPKLEFLYSIGASSSDAVALASRYPSILASSLKKKLVPSFNFWNALFESESETLRVVKRFGDILTIDPDSFAARNVETLREWGVPRLKIITLFRFNSVTLRTSPSIFKETLEEIRKLGFDPKTTKFVLAVLMLRGISKRGWAKKVDVYQKYGWSAKEFMSAFRRYPFIVGISKDKIVATMDFFVREIGLEPSVITKYPSVLALSLEKRIAPRASVVQILLSKGFLNERFSLNLVFAVSEKLFLERYIHSYEDEVPGLLKLYKQKLDLAAQPGKV